MKGIPTYIQVLETQYGGICEAVIGLEKEPTQEELNELKVQMKYKILEYLSNRKEEYLRNYNDKVECLNEINKEAIKQDILKYIEENKYYN